MVVIECGCFELDCDFYYFVGLCWMVYDVFVVFECCGYW